MVAKAGDLPFRHGDSALTISLTPDLKSALMRSVQKKLAPNIRSQLLVSDAAGGRAARLI